MLSTTDVMNLRQGKSENRDTKLLRDLLRFNDIKFIKSPLLRLRNLSTHLRCLYHLVITTSYVVSLSYACVVSA